MKAGPDGVVKKVRATRNNEKTVMKTATKARMPYRVQAYMKRAAKDLHLETEDVRDERPGKSMKIFRG